MWEVAPNWFPVEMFLVDTGCGRPLNTRFRTGKSVWWPRVQDLHYVGVSSLWCRGRLDRAAKLTLTSHQCAINGVPARLGQMLPAGKPLIHRCREDSARFFRRHIRVRNPFKLADFYIPNDESTRFRQRRCSETAERGEVRLKCHSKSDRLVEVRAFPFPP